MGFHGLLIIRSTRYIKGVLGVLIILSASVGCCCANPHRDPKCAGSYRCCHSGYDSEPAPTQEEHETALAVLKSETGERSVEFTPWSAASSRAVLVSMESDAQEEVLPTAVTPLSASAGPSARSLSLDDAIALALARNPSLETARAAEPVAHAAYHVAETYPWNPQFQTQVLPYYRDRNGNDGVVSQQHVIVQTFELGRQRQFRKGAAAANWRQVNGTIRQAELTVAAQTANLYFTALYQRELRDMNRTLAEANEQLLGVMQRREKAGQATRADVELTRLEVISSRRQLRLADAGYREAITNLQNQWNLDAHDQIELNSDWLSWRWTSIDHILSGIQGSACNDWDDPCRPLGSTTDVASPRVPDDVVLRQLVRDRPDVAAARAGIAMAAENLRLAKAMKRPNLQIGPMWQRNESAGQYWGVQAQMDIPVVNTGQTLVQQRCAELHQQQVTADQLENQAVLEARAAILRYERARMMVEESYPEFARPMAESLRPFQDQFKAGQITVIQVFAARATIIQSRQSYLAMLNKLTLAAASVMQTTGVPPELLVTSNLPQASPHEELPMP